MKRARMRLSSVNMVLPGTLLVLARVRRPVGAFADIIILGISALALILEAFVE